MAKTIKGIRKVVLTILDKIILILIGFVGIPIFAIVTIVVFPFVNYARDEWQEVCARFFLKLMK